MNKMIVFAGKNIYGVESITQVAGASRSYLKNRILVLIRLRRTRIEAAVRFKPTA